MLKQWEKTERPSDAKLEERLQEARRKLQEQQLKVKEHGLPVLVLVEGWGTAGKGSLIGQIIKNIDPRFFKVASMAAPTEEEKRKPFLYRHFVKIPESGKFSFLDSGWMDEIMGERLHEKLGDEAYAHRIESVKRFERQLTDNGYLVVKLFLQVSKKEQEKRIEHLSKEKDTRWRVSRNDRWQNEHYEKCLNAFDSYLKETNLPSAPWYIIDAESKKWTELQALEILTEGIDVALANNAMAVPILQNVFSMEKMPLLSEIPLDKTIGEDEYKKELKRLQNRLGELHNRLYRKKVPVIIAYEGWDAAGKGGNIKRITGALDPRGYEVHPIASPEPHEKARHYLWRFWTRLPKTGHIAIFDRTWYGRVMVERLEGFCSENDWKRAYNEINEFEKELHDWGAVIIKFWVQIDKDTQLERFNERQNTPEKQWKITDEDWRNRDKWDDYEKAVDEMYQAVLDAGWDGEWFLRAYDAESRKVGSHECEDGQIYIEPQGFCVIAEIGLEEGCCLKAMESVEKYLDTKYGIVLLQPPYHRYHVELGEISSYPPGYKENAGIFCHNNPWISIAETVVGRGNRAWQVYTRTCPAYIEDISEIHRTEPYVYSQMIAGKDAPNFGEAKNSWLTGTAAWTFLDVSQFILGIRPDYDGLTVDPCIPSKLDGFTAKRDFRGVSYHITVKNPNHVEKGVLSMIVDGQPVEGTTIPFSAEKKDVNVEVTMG